MNKPAPEHAVEPSEKETRIIVLSPDSSLTPETLAKQLISFPIIVKTTCWGLILSGDPQVLQKAIQKLRPLDPNRIFTKVRGYPPGDPRICRFQRGGGPRPGFHFLEFESALLPLISKALDSQEELLPIPEKMPEKKPLPAITLKKIIEETEK